MTAPPGPDVRARTHVDKDQIDIPLTCENVPTDDARDATHMTASDHLTEAAEHLAEHPVVATLPPTVAEAFDAIWSDDEDFPMGTTGKVAAALVGLVQMLALGVLWTLARVCFATKARTALSALALLAALAAWAIANHA